MSTDDPAPPPSPSTARQRYATTASFSSHESPSQTNSNWSSPYSSLAVRCAALPNSSVNAFCGAVAGIASGIVTCPLDVIKTRLQSQGSWRPRNPKSPPRVVYSGLIGTARVIWLHDGIRGMYRGLGPMLLGYIPTWAVYMSVYDFSKDFFYTRIGLWDAWAARDSQLTVYRKQMAFANIRFGHGRGLFDTSNKSDMGHQNTVNVASQRSSI